MLGERHHGRRNQMKLRYAFAAAIMGIALAAAPGRAETGADRLYIFDCGHGHSEDQSRWTPGLNVGKPFDVSDNCYLIHHAQGYLLWDTGIPDSVADIPEGVTTALNWRRPVTIAKQ